MTKTKKAPSVEAPQVDKFREAARELETDQSEEAFGAIVTKIAKSSKVIAEQKKKSMRRNRKSEDS